MAKRGYGEGSISKLPSGNWNCKIMDGYKDDGKRKMVSLTAPTRNELLDKIRQFKEDKEHPPLPKETSPLFSEIADNWYNSYRSQVEASTYASYYYTLAILKNHFDNIPIKQIKTSDINAFVNYLQEKQYSTSVVRKCRAMMIQIFDAAESDDLIEKNYARRAFTGKKKRTLEHEDGPTKDAFTLDEFQILMKFLPEDRIGYSIRLMLISGLRLQELIALTPQDLAEDGSWVNVTKAVKMVHNCPIMGVTKSHSSVRLIPIAPCYRYIVKWLRANCGNVYLWCNPRRDNLLCDVGYVRRHYYKEIERIPAVRRLSPHCCRHTFVTLLQSQGISMETIAKLTGHADIQTTGIYLHISETTLEKAVSSLASLI